MVLANQDIDTLTEVHPFTIGRCRVVGRQQFIIRDVGTGRTVLLDAVGDPAAGVIQVRAAHVDIVCGKHRFNVLHDAFGFRWQFTLLDREVGTVNLAEQGAELSVVAAGAGINANLPVGLVDRLEEPSGLMLPPT